MSQKGIDLRLTINNISKTTFLNTFDEIYADNYKTMFRVAKKMVGNYDDASDIVQEVFIYLFDKLNNGNQILHPKSWLYRATTNKCYDNLRRQKRFQSIEILSDHKNEDENIATQEMKAAINFMLSKLNPQEKVLAVLYSEGLSYKELSETTGIKFTSIGKMLSRALKKLEKEFKYQHYELY